MARTGQYGGSERWQGTVIIENGDWYGKCKLPVIFSMERTGAPLPAVGSGAPVRSIEALELVVKIHQHAKFQVVACMRAWEKAPKP